MKRFGAVVVALACLASIGAFAQPMRGHRGIPPDVAQRAGVSPDQLKKIQQLTFEANDQLINLRADVQKARLELQRQLSAPTVDQKAVMAQVDKVSRAQAEVKKNRLALMLKVRDTVGADAWQKLQMERQQRREGRMHERRMRRGGMGEADPMQGPGDGPDEMFANAPPPGTDAPGDDAFDPGPPPELGAP